jgi:hypothetical protein
MARFCPPCGANSGFAGFVSTCVAFNQHDSLVEVGQHAGSQWVDLAGTEHYRTAVTIRHYLPQMLVKYVLLSVSNSVEVDT